MRVPILAVAGGAFCLILSASQGYAGAAKAGGCTTTTPGPGTPNTCSVMAPTGSQQVDPPGNIAGPDTTFISNAIDDFGSGSGNSTSFDAFLGFPGYSNDFDGSQGIQNSVLEFDGTFTAMNNSESTSITGAAADDSPQVFDIDFNCGSSVQLFVNNQNVDLTPVDPTACADEETSGITDPLDTASLTLPIFSVNTFVLDFYTGTGDPNTGDGYNLSFGINGQIADDSLPGGTVPEPASLSLLGAALAGLGIIRRRRKRG